MLGTYMRVCVCVCVCVCACTQVRAAALYALGTYMRVERDTPLGIYLSCVCVCARVC